MARRQSPVEAVTFEPEMHCSVPEQRRLLGQSPFFSKLDDDAIVDIQRRFRQQHYHAGDRIQRAGDIATRLSVVAAGVVKIVRPTLDGQDVLLDFVGAGEYFGSLAELGDSLYREDVTAHTDCCILNTTAEIFHDLLRQYPTVALAALTMVAARLNEAQATIEQLSAYPADQRIASVLLQLVDKIGKQRGTDVLIQMPLSRQDIADMTGAKVETVSRVMSDFRRSGLIESGRRWISVVDRDALAAIADGNTR
ncbi:MAG TPA: Crp/Fnr family transcriptional regulator [Thermomicrobiales bacterium]|nr:Crp/Fnr family transcriptional regulator [Thermomicrobiales bacterium]